MLGDFVQIFEQINGIVGIQLAKVFGDDLVVEVFENILKNHAFDLYEDLSGEFVTESEQNGRALVAGQAFEHVTQISRVKRENIIAEFCEAIAADGIDQPLQQIFNGCGVCVARKGKGLCLFAHERPHFAKTGLFG